jgi:hypothetical protein
MESLYLFVGEQTCQSLTSPTYIAAMCGVGSAGYKCMTVYSDNACDHTNPNNMTGRVDIVIGCGSSFAGVNLGSFDIALVPD